MASSAELLRLAATALDNGEDPFSPVFLGEHDVTFDQCTVMATQLAAGARIMARAIENPKGPEALVMFADMMREPSR